MSFQKQIMFSIISLKAQVCASASTDYEKADARSKGILRQRLGNRADCNEIMSEKGMVVCMEKYAWRGKIVPGMQEEYKKRHDNIWPEMKEVLANAGIVNYSIWMQGEELFGYYECEKGVDYAAKVQAESDVVKNGMSI